MIHTKMNYCVKISHSQVEYAISANTVAKC